MDDQLTRFARSVSLACALAATLVGALVLLSWTTTGNVMLASVSRGIVMKTNTALGLLLTGLALLALRPEPTPALLKFVGRALALVVLVLGVATFSQHLTGWDLGIDEWLMTEPVGAPATTSPNRMGPPAALSFAMVMCASRRLDDVGGLLLERRDEALAIELGDVVVEAHLPPALDRYRRAVG